MIYVINCEFILYKKYVRFYSLASISTRLGLTMSLFEDAFSVGLAKSDSCQYPMKNTISLGCNIQ